MLVNSHLYDCSFPRPPASLPNPGFTPIIFEGRSSEGKDTDKWGEEGESSKVSNSYTQTLVHLSCTTLAVDYLCLHKSGICSMFKYINSSKSTCRYPYVHCCIPATLEKGRACVYRAGLTVVKCMHAQVHPRCCIGGHVVFM